MSGPRHLHVYRVTEVAEWEVEDDNIYDDDAEMLGDVIEAAQQGVLDFEPSDAEYVAMIWDEDNRLVIKVVEEELPEGVEQLDLYCPECLGRQRLTSSGPVCQRGHGGVDGISKVEVLERRTAKRAEASVPTRTRALRPPRSPRKRNSR